MNESSNKTIESFVGGLDYINHYWFIYIPYLFLLAFSSILNLLGKKIFNSYKPHLSNISCYKNWAFSNFKFLFSR